MSQMTHWFARIALTQSNAMPLQGKPPPQGAFLSRVICAGFWRFLGFRRKVPQQTRSKSGHPLHASRTPRCRHRIALQAGKLCSFHRTMAKASCVSFRSQPQNLSEVCIHIISARRETSFAGGLGKAVPGANVLANVATIEPAFKIGSYVR